MEKFSYFINRLFVQMYDMLYKLKPHCENVRLFIFAEAFLVRDMVN